MGNICYAINRPSIDTARFVISGGLFCGSYVRPVIRRYIEAHPFRKRELFSQFESG